MKIMLLLLASALAGCAGFNVKGGISFTGEHGTYTATSDGKTVTLDASLAGQK